MNALRYLSLTLLALLLAACSQTPAPDAVLRTAAVVEIISQPETAGDTGTSVLGGVGQTFTPTSSGFVTKITFYGATSGSGKLNFYVYDGSTFSIQGDQAINWVIGENVVFINNPETISAVTAGSSYAFFINGEDATTNVRLQDTGDLYAGGALWIGGQFNGGQWPPTSPFDGGLDTKFEIVIEDSLDSTPPALTVPADVTLEAPADTSPTSTGIATATDDTDPNPSVIFSDVVTPGSCDAEFTLFRTWTATDDNGNSTSAVQIITVQDTTVPSLSVPADVTVIEGESADPADTGIATASDDAASGVTVAFSDAVVTGNDIERTWTATDDCGNISSEVQTITVLTTQEAIANLIGEVESLGLQKGLENSLVKKLSNAIRNLDDGLAGEAVDKLMSFIDEVMAQSGKKVDADDADSLIDSAQRISNVL